MAAFSVGLMAVGGSGMKPGTGGPPGRVLGIGPTGRAMRPTQGSLGPGASALPLGSAGTSGAPMCLGTARSGGTAGGTR